jgi:tellurite resistance-related uncharacterized protein
MTETSTPRFIVARQTYNKITTMQGKLKDIEPATENLRMIHDPQCTAETVVDLAMGDPGIVFTVIDTRTQDHVAVYANENQDRQELLVEVIEAMKRFDVRADQVASAEA